jgi:signal transduction histidine kinase
MKSTLRVAYFCVLLIVALLFLHLQYSPLHQLSSQPGTLTLGHAQFFLDAQDTLRQPPADESADTWTQVKLPHVWHEHAPEMRGTGWYRIPFTVEDNSNLQSLLIARLGLNANVYLDGILIGSYGDLRINRFFRPWNRAMLMRMPGERLRAGPHQIDIELLGTTNYFSGLGTVVLGSDLAIQSYFAGRFFMQNTVAQVAAGLCLASFAAFIAIWSRMTPNREFLITALLMLNLTLWISGFSTFQLPFGMTYYARSMYTLHTITLCLILQIFVFRLKIHQVLGAALVWGSASLMVASLWNLDMDGLLGQLGLITAVLGAVGILLAFRSLMDGSTTLDVPGLAPVFTLTSYLVLTFNDLATVTSGDLFDNSLITPYLGMLLPLTGTYYLLISFITAYQNTRHSNARLQLAVTRARDELSTQYEKLATVEKGRLLQEERQRLMADMHDGMGSQLISTLTALKVAPLAQADMVNLLQHCVDDLRLTIDSLEPTHQDILTLLGNFRYRMEPRLRLAGIKLNWQVDDIPDLNYLNPRKSLQLLRIVQEAFTNIIKHAHCTEIDFHVKLQQDSILICITDNGKGVDGTEKPGKGIGNMTRRAAQMGFVFNRAPENGYTVSVRLPVPQ